MNKIAYAAIAGALLFPLRAGLSRAPNYQAGKLPQGVIIEKLVCADNASESYALYLPSKYSPDRKWPILYALDAGARGVLPVRCFQAAAEKYGYIVAGSNNSRNGPLTIVENALNALFADTGARLSIDPARIYLAGFSGGARAAVMAGYALNGKIAGVIGCGAGFPESTPPSQETPFAFFGIIGTEDFNFPELQKLDLQLNKFHVPHQLEMYQGEHEWPPESACARTLEWLELQAMKSGTRPKDDAMLQEIFDGRRLQAQTCEASNRLYDAFLQYSAMAEDFAGLKGVTEEAAAARRLESSEEVKKSIAREKDIARRQERAEEEFSRLVGDARQGRERPFAVQKLNSLLRDLKKEAGRRSDNGGTVAARRVLTRFWIQLNEAASEDFDRREYRLASMMLQWMAEIRPDNAPVYYQLGRAFSLAGNRKAAIGALKNAVRCGFRDAAVLENSPDFESLRGEEDFAGILKEIRGKAGKSEYP